jgi:dihydroorotase
VLVDLDSPWTVAKENILYKCGWSPMEGQTYRSKVIITFINGTKVYNKGSLDESIRGERLAFER